MDLTPEIVLPDQVWSQIFKYINPKTLMKLRNVNVQLMNQIEKFLEWKTLFFDSSTLAPWRNQLCEMYDPNLNRNEYDSQPDGFYKKLIAFYISWKSIDNAEKPQQLLLHSERDDKDDNIINKFDSYGNFLAYITYSNTLYIFNENTLKLVADPIKPLYSGANKPLLITIKVWQPHSSDSEDQTYLLKRKLFIIVQWYESMFIWDVDEKVSVPVPEILQEIYRTHTTLINVKDIFRCENDIYVTICYHLLANFDIVKLVWNQREEKITGRIIFRKLNSPGFYRITNLFDMYTENQKLMLVLPVEDTFYFTQTDMPKVNDPPKIMTLNNNLTELKQIFTDFEGNIYGFTVRINNSYVITVSNDKNFYVALKKETQDGGYDFVTKLIHGCDRHFEISNCIFKFDVLFIATKQSDVRIYTFKNSNHLMDIDLFTDKAKVIATGIRTTINMSLIARKNIPHALFIPWYSNAIVIKL
ncbi:uncharacterized protein LOC141525145 [Cotesia typhae]|uniref:uncharacterized protein LOC141525145 n=1 Tax=Cotesia typhae TaxID=2053667 RepID=UPI003D690286